MAYLQATHHDITLGKIAADIVSIDLFFDEHRVWSVDLREHDRSQPLQWPASLKKYLRGSTLLSVYESATDELLASAEIEFSPEPVRTLVVDSADVPLSINKWGRLGRTLDDIGEGIGELILDRAEDIIIELKQIGLRPFVVGGTLLGAVREGKLLPHDDDADIAYLSEHTNPIDVAVEGFWVGRQLENLGYEVMRHSATHMQLHFRADLDSADYYIDVFAAFFTNDGQINQPFHVRGAMEKNQMLPFSTVTISGRNFPAPADPHHWLVINYDKDWRTPIPGYTISTPLSTIRRFEHWFGSFNFARHFWNGLYTDTNGDLNRWSEDASWIITNQSILTSPALIDLGSGSGALPAQLAGHQRHVIATDYGHVPLGLSRKAGIRAKHLNLLRLNVLAAPLNFGIETSFDVTANHVLEQVPHKARENALRLIRLALVSGGAALATLYGEHVPDVTIDQPTGWHLSREDLAIEAEAFGMTVEFFEMSNTSPESLDRDPYGARFILDIEHRELQIKEVTVKQRIARALRSARANTIHAEVAELNARIDELQLELDEYREHSLRVAQLLELAEQRFNPAESENQKRADM